MVKQKKQKIEAEPEPEPESEAEEIEEDEEVEDEENEEDEEDEDVEEGDESDEEDDEEEEDDEDGEDDDEDEDMDEEEEQHEEIEVVSGARKEDVVDDLHYDAFNLTGSNYHPLRWKNDEDREKVIAQASTRVAQLLYKKLKSYPTEPSDAGQITILPNEVLALPRYTKVPEPKPETKWEKFAREKGIQKKKKDRMVYDDVAGDYKPRFGYQRISNGIEDIPIVEVKAGQDPFADPWAADRKDKKERIDKNKKNQMRNVARIEKAKGKGKRGFDAASLPGIPIDIDESKKKGKVGVRNTLQLVQHSTASMGRFDEKRQGEPTKKIAGKKRSFRDNFIAASDEKAAMKSQIRFVADKKDKKARGVTNSLAAYEGILPDAPSNAFKKSKGRGKNAGKEQKKKR